jgi:hypothetical protein
MVTKFKTILSEMRAERGSVDLFALLKMDEFTDRWTVLLSADWAKEGDFESFKYVHDLIGRNITAEEMATIARFGVFARTNHLVELLMKYKSDSRIVEEKVNGNVIHDGYILGSGEAEDMIEVVPIKQ